MTKPDGDSIRTYLGEVRRRYLDEFRKAVEHAQVEAGKSGRKLLVEAAASNDAAGEALPYRLDVVSMGADKSVQPTTVAADHDVPWEPAESQFGEFLVEVEKFVWSVCIVVGEPAPAEEQLPQLKEWFLRWFQREGHHGEKPFGGVVHFMSEPQVTEDVLRVQVDLGSAPVDALVDLLETFGKMGARDGLVFTPEEAFSA